MSKQIVFIENHSTVMLYKIAKKFKEKGYETILIRLLKPTKMDTEFYDSDYSKVINLNLINSKPKYTQVFKIFNSLMLFKLKPYIIFGKANPNIPIAFFRRFFKNIPFVYFPYDIRCHSCHPNPEKAKILHNLSNREINAERYNFENADGILHKGNPNELKYLNGRMLGNNIKLPKNKICFHPYCSKEFMIPLNKNKLSKKDGEIHMVYLTTGGILSKDSYEPFMALARKLNKLKIHFHLSVDKTRNL